MKIKNNDMLEPQVVLDDGLKISFAVKKIF